MRYYTYCPYKHKYELVTWASEHFKEKASKYNKMSKKQLYAIYYKEGKQKGDRVGRKI